MCIKNKYIFICLLAFLALHKGYAQTGIGTKNPQAILRIDGNKDNETTGTPSAAKAVNDVMVTTAGRLGVGVVTPATKVDLRSADQKGIIGIGTNTAQTAAQAGGGAMRYNAGFLEYSDGVTWIPLPLTAPTKALVLANKSTSQNIANSISTVVTTWAEVTDPANNFDNSTGIFTAPRDGFYIVSFNIVLTSNTIANNTKIETIIESNNTSTDNIGTFRSVNSYPAYQSRSISNSVAGNCSAIFNLKAGNTIQFRVLHNLGTTRGTSTTATDNSISIAEL